MPSQAGNGSYVVDPTEMFDGATCSCPDFEERQEKCKHVYAVEYTLRRETNAKAETTVTESLKVTYSQDWAAYNAAQVHEKERVAMLLRDLCAGIENAPQGKGRLPAPAVV